MVRAFISGKFAQSFFSEGAKRAVPLLVQTANLTTQAILITKLTGSLPSKGSTEEIANHNKSTDTKLNM
ncbi:hypothetical protein ACQUW5_03310 [Legionella sp. CNM-1927-20]|uniref:hypothetical protein n=1 Tax=Legionella sp. CNM-1927-20 TaxID=3422221 RepID=UPI00403AE52B